MWDRNVWDELPCSHGLLPFPAASYEMGLSALVWGLVHFETGRFPRSLGQWKATVAVEENWLL